MAYSYKTSIAFGLVYIPVKLHAAVKENTIGFNMLDKKTMSRVKYKKTCEECDGREVSQKDIVKGFEYEDGRYVVFENDELEKIKTPKDKSITIESFISPDEVDSVYFNESYYVEPTGADKAYSLLVKAMEKEKRAGLAKSVLGTKESLILLYAEGGILRLSTLHFADEVQKIPFNADSISANDKELNMAVALIKAISGKFEPENYKNEYNARLEQAIADKVAGKAIAGEKQTAQPKITDLMTALQESMRLMMSEGQKPAKTAAKKTNAPAKTRKRA